jgi:deoxyribodipyrimidine photo-lyase
MSKAIVWFKNDLRIGDNKALHEASKKHAIIPLFILDSKNPHFYGSAQKWWLHHSLKSLEESLEKIGLKLVFKRGDPLKILPEIVSSESVEAVFWNRSYEPYCIERDSKLNGYLTESSVKVESFPGYLFCEPWKIKNAQGSFFKVFTPFWKNCLITLNPDKPLPVPKCEGAVTKTTSDDLESWNLLPTKPNWAKHFEDAWSPGEAGARKKLNFFVKNSLIKYDKDRDFPSEQSTSYLSPHLHFGEISPNYIYKVLNDKELSFEKYLSELGWREFSYNLLYHFNDLPTNAFNSKFNDFPWSEDKQSLERWQKGQTGYPIVDAGMRELWQTGYMHNRVRMIVASFLTKHLLIPWQEGAAWFWDTLLDADLANNSASWQWVAGCGADAAPYFRIFNPIIQSQKFDPEGQYIRKWVPEIAHMSERHIHTPWKYDYPSDYPEPIIDHTFARNRALAAYEKIK